MTTTFRQRFRPLEILLAPLRWLERSRGWRRRVLMVAYLFVGVVIGFFIWLATSLNDLPDIGDPFDVKSFIKSTEIAESDDAFVLYKKAVDRLRYEPAVTQNWTPILLAIRSGWTKTNPEIRSWVEANRESLNLWREGTTRPDGVAENLKTIVVIQNNIQNPIVI